MARTRDVAAIVIGGVLVAAALAFFVSPFASPSPDGLEKVATDQGFADSAERHPLDEGPLAGYEVEGVRDGSLRTGLSGLIGVAATFGVALVLFGIVRRRRARDAGGRDAGSPAATG